MCLSKFEPNSSTSIHDERFWGSSVNFIDKRQKDGRADRNHDAHAPNGLDNLAVRFDFTEEDGFHDPHLLQGAEHGHTQLKTVHEDL